MKFILMACENDYGFAIHIDQIRFIDPNKEGRCVLTVHRSKGELREGITEEIELKESFSEFIERLKTHGVIFI